VNPSLGGVRRRLTAWYIGVFAVILTLFGTAVYTVITTEVLTGINRDLERIVNRRTRLVLSDRIPTDIAQDTALYDGRVVYVFDAQAQPFSPPRTQPWIQEFARQVLADSVAKKLVRTPDGRQWIAYGKKFRSTAGRTWATIAVVQTVELRDLYPSLFTGFVASAVISLLLVGIGGATLAAKSTRPIEQTFDQMRRFMGDAAHELKTPVAVLRARADVALQRPRSVTDYQETLQAISSEGKRLGMLVENMLLLARADAGQWPFEKKQVFLDDLLIDAASAARALAAVKQVDVDVEELDETAVHGDPNLIRQLLMILLDNAVSFTPPGGKVTASAQRNGRYCKIIISDTGVGIPASALPHVFERFYRADPARGRAGAGLGLSIARWIADTHEAKIQLSSVEGSGTTVEVAFPSV